MLCCRTHIKSLTQKWPQSSSSICWLVNSCCMFSYVLTWFLQSWCSMCVTFQEGRDVSELRDALLSVATLLLQLLQSVHELPARQTRVNTAQPPVDLPPFNTTSGQCTVIISPSAHRLYSHGAHFSWRQVGKLKCRFMWQCFFWHGGHLTFLFFFPCDQILKRQQIVRVSSDVEPYFMIKNTFDKQLAAMFTRTLIHTWQC